MFEYIRERVGLFVKSRIFVLMIVMAALCMILIRQLYNLQIVQGQENEEKAIMQIRKEREITATRGTIKDRNGKTLAYNELAYSVVLEDNGTYDTTDQRNRELNDTIYRLVQMIESNGDSIDDSDFGIAMDDNGGYQFKTEAGTASRYRFIADIYGESQTSKLTEEQKNSSADEIMEYLCKGTKKSKMFDVDEELYDKTEQLKIVVVRYKLYQYRFSKYITAKVATEISEGSRALIMENLADLQGVTVEEDYVRRYDYSEYMASIIGYTGLISQEEYDNLLGEGEEGYALTDVVGKSGLEKELDTYLQGAKGKETIYVDSLGKVLETEDREDPSAGNDIYLTIDADLQKAAYHVVEQKIAGILVDKIQNIPEHVHNNKAKDIRIAITEVWFAFFDNEVLDITHFTEEDARETERTVQSKFESKQQSVMEQLRADLTSEAPVIYKDASKEYQVYYSYIVNNYLPRTTGILVNDRIDTEDEVYKAWKEESISLQQFLTYAVSMNWLDSSRLDIDEKYSSAEEVYEALVNYMTENLVDEVKFTKKMFKYMILDGQLTGHEVCQLLFEQGILEDNDANRASAANSPYDFIKDKIRKLEITPAQLALEPCSGSAVITEPSTGKVLACVSYPGYDNNRLANSMDTDYYNYLNDNSAQPFFNHATQEVTAPGSTFKMVAAAAGLTEGVISTGETIKDEGEFWIGTSTPHRCHIYVSSRGNHGLVDVEAALEVSCNYFFYEVGMRLSGGQGNYTPQRGLDVIEKYAALFGLGEYTNIEITESKGKVSDEFPVPSMIGQGTNAYTTAQLARYVTTIANNGTRYDLTLLDRVEDTQGNVIETFINESSSEPAETLSASTWNAVQNGMKRMAGENKILSEVQTSMAGKTGTAEQSKIHANHALFVGYAPADNPEIAFSMRITNGYTSANAVEMARDIVKYKFDELSMEDIVTGEAAMSSNIIVGD